MASSFYEQGIGDDRLVTVWTPSAMKAEINAVDGMIEGLNRTAVRNEGALGRELFQQWRQFRTEWQAFRDGVRESWSARWSGVMGDRALDYRKRAEAWGELFRRRAGGDVAAAPGQAPPPSTGGIPWKGILGVGALLGVAWLGVHVADAVRGRAS